jgi:hypothetical protein
MKRCIKLPFIVEAGDCVPRVGTAWKKVVQPGSKAGVPVKPVFKPIADILTTIPNIFSPVSDIFPTVSDSAIALSISDVFAAIQNIFSTIAEVLTTVTYIFPLVPCQRRACRRSGTRHLALAILAEQTRRPDRNCKTSPQNKPRVRLHIEMTPFITSQVFELTLSLLRPRSHYTQSRKEPGGFNWDGLDARKLMK